MAETGSSDTIPAAASGENPCPSTRRTTARKSAPTSAPEISATTAVASARPRPRIRSGTSSDRSAAATATNATGACATKIARQSKTCVSVPPSAGPAAAPIAAAAAQTAGPSSTNAPQSTSAPPTPWTARSATSIESEVETAQPIVAVAKTRSPTVSSLRVRRRLAAITTTVPAIAAARL